MPPPAKTKAARAKLIRDLQKRLSENADEQKREWFNKYLRGAILYRGVPTPKIAEILKESFAANKTSQMSAHEQLKTARELLAQPFAEDKFAAILWMQKPPLCELCADTILGTLEDAFARGDIHDWSTNDWLCVRVLDSIAMSDSAAAARIAKWRNAKSLWQRRSSIVAFRGAARAGKHSQTIAAIVADLLPTGERFLQTGIGWCLADMSKHFPQRARRLFLRHFAALSVEVIDRHAKHLPDHQKWRARKRAIL